MEVFATFYIYNSTGHRVAEGHKASFCLEDNQCLPDIEPRYACADFGDQGKGTPTLSCDISFYFISFESNNYFGIFHLNRHHGELLRYLSFQHRLPMG